VIQVAIRMRASARVVKVCRWTYSTLRTLLNASLTALSKHEPTRPMDWKTPSRRQAPRNLREAYSLDSTGRRNTALLDQQ
jgi:hypothetical protein